MMYGVVRLAVTIPRFSPRESNTTKSPGWSAPYTDACSPRQVANPTSGSDHRYACAARAVSP